MITGFNTDVKHRGVVYHVQTEDKGTSNPMIETLIYKGGEILGSRRLPYADLVKRGDEPAITRLMEDQHKGMLLEVKRPAEALKEYEASQAREPNRYRATLGAAQAADKAGERKKAAFFYGQLLQLAKNADTPRAELADAKRYLGTK